VNQRTPNIPSFLPVRYDQFQKGEFHERPDKIWISKNLKFFRAVSLSAPAALKKTQTQVTPRIRTVGHGPRSINPGLRELPAYFVGIM
jgi:hypothetical protein